MTSTRWAQLAITYVVSYWVFGYFAVTQWLFNPGAKDPTRTVGFYAMAEMTVLVWLPFYYFICLTILRHRPASFSGDALMLGVTFLPVFLYSLVFGFVGPWPFELIKSWPIALASTIGYFVVWGLVFAMYLYLGRREKPSVSFVYRLAAVAAVYGTQLPVVVLPRPHF